MVTAGRNARTAAAVGSRMATLTELTDDTFDETVLGASKPVLVDFTAAWCGPCHALAPILEEVAVEHADKLEIVQLDVDANPNTTRRFDVMSMPTLILFKDGVAQRKMIGARGKHHLLDELSDFL
jgi:thioredoxin 1